MLVYFNNFPLSEEASYCFNVHILCCINIAYKKGKRLNVMCCVMEGMQLILHMKLLI